MTNKTFLLGVKLDEVGEESFIIRSLAGADVVLLRLDQLQRLQDRLSILENEFNSLSGKIQELTQRRRKPK